MFITFAGSGFVGPADIFRNRQAIFCLAEPPVSSEESPFDLTLTSGGDDFAILGMHFKLGLYEHQSSGAIQAVIDLLQKYPQMLASGKAVKAFLDKLDSEYGGDLGWVGGFTFGRTKFLI